MLIIQFETDNAAFPWDESESAARAEVSRVLTSIATRVGNGWDGGITRDINGNHIGKWTLERPKAAVIFLKEGEEVPHA